MPAHKVIPSPAFFLETEYASANTLAAALETHPTTIWRWAKEGRIPQPVKLGPNTTRWAVAGVREALGLIGGVE